MSRVHHVLFSPTAASALLLMGEWTKAVRAAPIPPQPVWVNSCGGRNLASVGIENSKSLGMVTVPPANRDRNRCRNDHLGLGKCSRTGAVLERGRTPR